MIQFWQELHTICPHCASNMDDGWCDTWTYGPRSICAMKDHIPHLRNRECEKCEIIRQLTDQLQEQNKDLSQLERKLGDLKNQVHQLEGHLERERQEKETLYYKNEASHECWDNDVIPGFQKRVLVDPERLRRLEQVYKERLTNNSQVTKAARLATREDALLVAEDILPAMKEALVKPLSCEVRKWTKAVRCPVGSGEGPGGGAGGADEDEDVEGDAFTQRKARYRSC